MDRSAEEQRSFTVSRRTTLRAAGVGIATAWVVPVVQVVAMASAHAASGAPRTGGGGGGGSRGGGGDQGGGGGR
jgi:hypothetical protein